MTEGIPSSSTENTGIAIPSISLIDPTPLSKSQKKKLKRKMALENKIALENSVKISGEGK